MDTRNSTLIVAIYLVVAFVILSFMAIAYYAYGRAGSAVELADAWENEGGTTTRSPSLPVPNPAARNRAFRQLQTDLVASRRQLEQTSAELKRKDAECKALQDRLDQSVGLLLQLLEEDTTGKAGLVHVAAKPATDLVSTSEVNLNDPNNPPNGEVISNALAGLSAEQESLMRLQTEAILAEFEWQAIVDESRRQTELASMEKRSIEQAATAALAACGDAAVPILIELITDERVEVRRWAAAALGAIGPAARDARLPLGELLSDPDEAVRERARDALAKLE